MIGPIALLLCVAVSCDVTVDMLGAPVPGAALGLVAMAACFALTGGPGRGLGQLFDGVAPHFPILFVPAAVGVVANLDRIAQEWLCIFAAVCAGTAMTLALTGLVAQWLVVTWRRPAL